jgi:hypothetical protein
MTLETTVQEPTSSGGAPSSSGYGFSFDPALLGGLAGKIGDAYDGVVGAISQFTDQAPDSPDDLGSEVSGQWEKWHPTFEQELSALKEAVGGMISKILSTGTNYETAERVNQAAAQHAGSGPPAAVTPRQPIGSQLISG